MNKNCLGIGDFLAKAVFHILLMPISRFIFTFSKRHPPVPLSK